MFSGPLARRKWTELQDAIDAAPIVVPCTNTDPDLWFPDETGSGDSGARINYKEARKLCKLCPVRELCLEYALLQPETDGMWGGLTPMERKQLRARPRK